MRQFEIAAAVLALASSLALLRGYGKRWPAWMLAALSIGAALASWQLEGYRWHVIPIYVAAALAGAAQFPRLGRLQSGALALVVLCLVVAGAWWGAVRFPVPAFEPLTGQFPVGTVSVALVDPDRLETLEPAGSRRRELMVQAWYPAESCSSCPASPYQDRASLNPSTSYLDQVRTRSRVSPAVSNSQPRYPVILFSPHFTGVRTEYTFLAEEMASHGFVVICIDHPYLSAITVFPDGRKAVAHRPFLDFSGDAAFEASLKVVEEDLDIRTKDMLFVSRLISQWPEGPIRGRMNALKIAAAGHSFGGSVAFEAAHREPRFRAVASLDSWLFGRSAENGIDQPYFYATEDVPEPTAAQMASPDSDIRIHAMQNKRTLDDVRRNLKLHGGYFWSFRGIRHLDFSDSGQLLVRNPFRRDRVSVSKEQRILTDYLLAFFGKYLRGEPAPLLSGASTNPFVHLEYWPRPATTAGASFDERSADLTSLVHR